MNPTTTTHQHLFAQQKLFTAKDPSTPESLEEPREPNTHVKMQVQGESDCAVSVPVNPTLPVNPTPMAVITMATPTHTSAVKPIDTNANPTPIPVTVYNLAQSIIQEIPNPPIRTF